MEYRKLGKTGLEVSILGFGCGAVGGLFVREEYREIVRIVARAVEAGITYFDTASSYGDGTSEKNIGLVLEELKPDVIVGTKVRLAGIDMDDIESGVVESVEGSLRRLKLDCVDLIQLHNPIHQLRNPERGWVDGEDVQLAIEAFQKLQQQGKVRHWGVTGLGETESLHEIVASGQAQTVQCCFNMLNPSAGVQSLAGFPFQDYKQLIDKAAVQQMGVIAIRVLAAGALSGSNRRHRNAAQNVGPIATGDNLAEDIARVGNYSFLLDEGYADNMVEAAIRFAISKPDVSTALVGFSDIIQLEEAILAAEKGALPEKAISGIAGVMGTSA